MSSKLVRVAVALVVLALCAALPALGLAASAPAGSGEGSGKAAHARPSHKPPHKKKKKARRCRWVRHKVHGHLKRKRVCRKPHKPVGEGPNAPQGPAPEGPGEEGGTPPGDGGDPGNGGGDPGNGGGDLPPGRLPPIPAGSEIVDLIGPDNGFETSTADFTPTSPGDGAVASGYANPIEGARSLELTVHEYGRIGRYFEYGFGNGPLADSVTARAQLRVDGASAPGRVVKVCAIAYLFEDEHDPIETCDTFPVDPDHPTEVFLEQNTEGKRLGRAYFQLTMENSGTLEATLDDAHLFVVQKTGSGGSGGSGGGGGGGGGAPCDLEGATVPNGPPDPASPCDYNRTPPPSTTYSPKTDLDLPAQHPFISLADYTAIPSSSPIYQAFKGWVDENIDDENPDGLFSKRDAVVMFARTGNQVYIERAIALVDADVAAEEARIAAGEQPSVSHDNYLDVGNVVEELALTYDYGFSRLTQSQKDRWKAYGDAVISNLWSPPTATWDGKPGDAAWSAWAINDPGNNYNFSFILATEMWALATQSQPWIHFLQEYKFPLISDYYAELPGGGSREGNGYGSSQRRLWENERMWKGSTGEALPTVEKHARESVDYWVHSTVPTRGNVNRDYYSPIGDLSRQSIPHLYDYQVNLVREGAMAAAPNSREANNALWWIRENKGVPETMTNRFNLHDALLVPTGTPQAPTALSYDAHGAGVFLARSSWAEDATWLQLVAGHYDQSHAHEEQGAFTLYRDDWLAVTSNIWSRSGLQGGGGGGDVRVGDLGTGVSNIVRFQRPGPPGGKPIVIGQDFGIATTSSETLSGDVFKAHADLTPMYENHATEVKGWQRDLEFQGDHLHVHDVCEVGADVTPVFQVNVPVQPNIGVAGTVTAGKLEVQFDPAYGVQVVDMTSFNAPPPQNPESEGDGIEFESGWRIDLTNPAGCAFDVDLSANP